VTHVFLRILPSGGAIMTHVFLRIVPSGDAIVTQIFVLVIWQRVRSILDINCTVIFCTLVPDVCCCFKYFSISSREALRKGSRCSCKVSFAADLKTGACSQIFMTVFSVRFHENPISGSGTVATERTERWRVERRTVPASSLWRAVLC